MGPPLVVGSTNNNNNNGKMTLSAQRRAYAELNERPELLPGILKKFRELIQDEANLRCPQNDEFLLRFLRARKFKMDRALKLLKNYFSMRRDHPELFEDLYPEALRSKLRHGVQAVLPDRDKEGRQIFLFNTSPWDPSECNMDDVFRCNYMFLEHLTSSPETQVNGIVGIVDFQGFSLFQARHFTPKHALRMISIIQDSYPARFKEFHMVNQPYIFNMVFSIVRPFLNEKIRNRVRLHGTDLSSLHEYVDPKILPESLGGSSSSCDRFLQQMYEKNDYYKEMLNYGYRIAEN